MHLKRHSPTRAAVAWTVLVLCICILMQMLGTTMTLWDFELQLDPDNAPLLEGFSLPALFAYAALSVIIAVLAISSESLRYCFWPHGLLRPPNSLM